jgi:hypothetical protein
MKNQLSIMNSNTSIHQLANLLLLNGWSIFGGYVRDLLAGDKPNDLDIFASQASLVNLLSLVVRSGYHVVNLDQSTYGPRGWKVIVKAPNGEQVSLDGEQVSLDIVNPGTAHGPDVDVNRLVLSADGIRVMGGKQYDFSTILLHIKEKRYVSEIMCPPHRIWKLDNCGWESLPDRW